MSETERTLSRRYATAFLNVYDDEVTSDVFECIKQAVQLLAQHKSALFFLSLPSMSDEQKLTVMQQLCGQFSLNQPCKRLMHLLVRDKRAQLLLDVLKFVILLYQERHGIMTFDIESSHQLADDQLALVKQFLAYKTGNDIIYSYRVNPKLIAGIRAQSKTRLWEVSVAKQLRAVRLALIK